MKYIVAALFLVNLSGNTHTDGIYLWECNRYGERSCCLNLSGVDICNPNVPCTRVVHLDLQGIYDYVHRLMGLEKSGSFSYVSMLQQAHSFIRHALASGMQITYRFDDYRQVKFLHEMIDMSPSSSKTVDKAAKSQSSTTAAQDKNKMNDKVFAYLLSQGLAREWKK